MPRNGSSVYSLPAGNPVIPGTTIATAWANGTLSDIATALTQSLSTDGSTASVSLSGKTMAGGTFNGPTVTGIMTLTGGRIAFPAVAVPSADPNTLDDYEEGTWTPSLTFAVPGNVVVGYGARVGTYTKIGNSVTVTCKIQTTTWTHTTSTGDMLITGIPFGAINDSVGTMGGTFFNTSSTIGPSFGSPVAFIGASTSSFVFFMSGVNNNFGVNFNQSNHVTGNNSLIMVNMTFIGA